MPVGGDRGLRQEAELAGDLLGGQAVDRLAVEHDRAALAAQQAGQGAQQRGLAARVGPDDHGDLAVGHVEVEAVGHDVAVVGERQPAGRRGESQRSGSGSSREEPQRYGAPITAVTMPTGSSVGASTRRAARSANVVRNAPTSAAGTTHAPGDDTRRRAIGPDDEGDEHDRSGGRDRQRRQADGEQDQQELGASDRHAERGGGVVAELEHDRASAGPRRSAAPSTARAIPTVRTWSQLRPLSEPVSHTAARWTS